MRRFQVSFVPPDVDAPLALLLPVALAADPLTLLVLLLAGLASAEEIPRPYTLLKSGWALADRSRLDAEACAAGPVAPIVLERSMELATVGEAGAVYEPLFANEVEFIVAREVADGVVASAPEDDATLGSLNVEARGVNGTGEG